MRILIVPDTHAPYHHPASIAFLRRLKRHVRPDVVVHIGDLGDQHGWSRHERQPDALGQAAEDEACLEFCRELYDLFPLVYACKGNHDDRLAKRCVRAGVPSRLHRTIAEIYDSPADWHWSDRHRIGDVAFEHGEAFGGKDAALKAALANRLPTVIGHIHSNAGVQYSAGPYSTVWGLSVGCLIDPASIAFTYAKKGSSRPVLGAGWIIDGVPHFEPMR